jgi:hypothetical protein
MKRKSAHSPSLSPPLVNSLNRIKQFNRELYKTIHALVQNNPNKKFSCETEHVFTIQIPFHTSTFIDMECSLFLYELKVNNDECIVTYGEMLLTNHNKEKYQFDVKLCIDDSMVYIERVENKVDEEEFMRITPYQWFSFFCLDCSEWKDCSIWYYWLQMFNMKEDTQLDTQLTDSLSDSQMSQSEKIDCICNKLSFRIYLTDDKMIMNDLTVTVIPGLYSSKILDLTFNVEVYHDSTPVSISVPLLQYTVGYRYGKWIGLKVLLFQEPYESTEFILTENDTIYASLDMKMINNKFPSIFAKYLKFRNEHSYGCQFQDMFNPPFQRMILEWYNDGPYHFSLAGGRYITRLNTGYFWFKLPTIYKPLYLYNYEFRDCSIDGSEFAGEIYVGDSIVYQGDRLQLLLDQWEIEIPCLNRNSRIENYDLEPNLLINFDLEFESSFHLVSGEFVEINIMFGYQDSETVLKINVNGLSVFSYFASVEQKRLRQNLLEDTTYSDTTFIFN